MKFALVAAGAVDVDYLVFKAKEKGEIKLGDDGKIKGEDDLITGLKTQHPAMFQVSNGNQQNNRKILEIIFQTVSTIRQSQKNSS